ADEFLAVPDMGVITFKGRSPVYVSAASLEEGLNSITGLARTRIVRIEAKDDDSGNYYQFEGSVRLNALALSGRFSDEWLKEDAIDRAQNAVDERLADATDAVTAAKAALDAGAVDASTILEEAQEDLAQATADSRQMEELTNLVAEAKDEVDFQMAALAVEVVGSAEALALAEVKAAELTQTLDALAVAINAWDEEARSLETLEARIAAAEESVASAEQALNDLDETVTPDDASTEDPLALAQIRLARAQWVLSEEQSYLEGAIEAESTTRAALDEALAAAAVVAPVDPSEPPEDSSEPEEES
ncbi:MAG: hypothetical protein MUP36_01745, partial [Demequinaceae bacterium]|nr:hypothetical protein [Demequinaceae bacterium]